MQTNKPRRVLVVEDDRKMAELVRLHLVDLGCEVHLAKPRYILTVWSVGYKFAEFGRSEN
jgi:CheY-like chemotaxis protein